MSRRNEEVVGAIAKGVLELWKKQGRTDQGAVATARAAYDAAVEAGMVPPDQAQRVERTALTTGPHPEGDREEAR